LVTDKSAGPFSALQKAVGIHYLLTTHCKCIVRWRHSYVDKSMYLACYSRHAHYLRK